MQYTEFNPSFVVNISDEFPLKMEAINKYESQFCQNTDQNVPTLINQPDF